MVISAAVAAAALTLVYFYPRLVKIPASTYEERFRKLYAEDPEFRSAVDELRSLTLDPGVPYDPDRAFTLFNSVLRKMGIPEIQRLYFRYGKSVKARAERPPEPAPCALPERLDLVIVQPEPDVDAGNYLEKVYACEYQLGSRKVLEVTLVFRNERRPESTLEDIWYEVWRLVTWGRSRDIETFFVVEEGSRTYVSFTGLALVLKDSLGLRLISPIGSGSKGYGESAHEDEKFEVSGSRIEVYVNTYNHALGLKDNNPGMEKAVFEIKPRDVVVGRRIDAENAFSDLKYTAEIVSVQP